MSVSLSPDVLSAVVSRLRAAGCVYAEDEARLLLSAAATAADLAAMADRRVAGLPLEQVVGWAEFCGLRIAVDPGVFVPRRRTEFLAGQAIARIRPGAVVVDLCCGSGAVGAALAAAVDDLELHAVDIDPAAVACARRNLVARGGRVYEGDLYAPLPAWLHGRVDVLVANAPYVPTGEVRLLPREARLYEPRVALDGGHRRAGGGAAGERRGIRMAGARRPSADRDQRASSAAGRGDLHRRWADGMGRQLQGAFRSGRHRHQAAPSGIA